MSKFSNYTCLLDLTIIAMKFVSGNENNDIPYLRLLLSFLFWMQYSLNFVLYAASNKQYRWASPQVKRYFPSTPPDCCSLQRGLLALPEGGCAAHGQGANLPTAGAPGWQINRIFGTKKAPKVARNLA